MDENGATTGLVAEEALPCIEDSHHIPKVREVCARKFHGLHGFGRYAIDGCVDVTLKAQAMAESDIHLAQYAVVES